MVEDKYVESGYSYRRKNLTEMPQDELDELVYEYKSVEASSINNGGREEQIDFILDFEFTR